MRPSIYFAHANGFPSECYQQLFTHLKGEIDIAYLPMSGHDPNYPVTQHWDYLVEEIIADIRQRSASKVVGVGHSLGGVLMLRAALAAPELFQQLIILDSPLLSRLKSHAVRIIKWLGMIDYITPAQYSRGRRTEWGSFEEALEYFRHKRIFKDFTEACLRDYVTYGLEAFDGGLRLRFDREIEVKIYRTIPHIMPRYHGRLQLPGCLVYGAKSNVVGANEIRNMRRHFGMSQRRVPGSHLFPFEFPEQTAHVIKGLIVKA
jgi:pimeloyl-ACP methyl ester carboxylesterase